MEAGLYKSVDQLLVGYNAMLLVMFYLHLIVNLNVANCDGWN